MKISQLSTDALKALLTHVETALALAPKPTKALVVRELSSRGYCAPSSSGTEKTLITAAKNLGVEVPAHLAKLMGVAPLGESQPRIPAAPAQPPQVSLPAPSQVPPPLPRVPETLPTSLAQGSILCLKSVSILKIDSGGNLSVTFNDGATKFGGRIDVSVLRSSCNLTEFNIS